MPTKKPPLRSRLRKARDAKKLGVRAAARVAGVSHPTIIDAEAGNTVPGLATLQKLAAAYGVELEALLP